VKLWKLLFLAGLLALPVLAQTSYSTFIPANPPGGVGAACSATTYGYLAPLTGGSRVVVCDPSTHLWTVVSGSGGTGCIPAGSVNQLLYDDGAGACSSSTVTVAKVTPQYTTAASSTKTRNVIITLLITSRNLLR